GEGASLSWPEEAWTLVAEAKRLGIADREIGWLTDVPQMEIRAGRKARGIVPQFRTVTTYATGSDDVAPYMYSTYEGVGVAGPEGADAGTAHDADASAEAEAS